MKYLFEWTIFGYYGGPLLKSASNEHHYTWYQVDDFGTAFKAEYIKEVFDYGLDY